MFAKWLGLAKKGKVNSSKSKNSYLSIHWKKKLKTFKPDKMHAFPYLIL